MDELTEEELDKKMELEFKIVSCTFFALFYGELIEKFAAQRNKPMVDMLQQNMILTQKLAIRYNTKYKNLLSILGIKQDAQFNTNYKN